VTTEEEEVVREVLLEAYLLTCGDLGADVCYMVIVPAVDKESSSVAGTMAAACPPAPHAGDVLYYYYYYHHHNRRRNICQL